VNQKPTDETTLSILSHSLKPLDRPLNLIGIYQHAWDVAPKIEEMGAQVFVAHVRTGRWSGAKLTGMKLWKAFNIERYLWWSIIAGVMQAERPFPPSPIPVLVMIPTRAQLAEREAVLAKDKVLSKEVLYGLAWRMAGTAPKESVLTPERIWLQASVAIRSAKRYEELGKEKEAKEMWAEALKVLESDAGERASATALHVEELRREVAAKNSQWDKEYGRMKERLEKGYAFMSPIVRMRPDHGIRSDRNWLTYITLLDSLFELETKPAGEHADAETNGEANGATAKPGLEDVRKLFKTLSQTDEEHAPSERASRLAILELESRLRKACKPSGDFIRLVTQYWERFSLKPVVVEDLLDFVKALEGEERAQWDAFVDAIPEDVVSSRLSCPMLYALELNFFSSLVFCRSTSSDYQQAQDATSHHDDHPNSSRRRGACKEVPCSLHCCITSGRRSPSRKFAPSGRPWCPRRLSPHLGIPPLAISVVPIYRPYRTREGHLTLEVVLPRPTLARPPEPIIGRAEFSCPALP